MSLACINAHVHCGAESYSCSKVAEEIAECQRVLEKSGLKYKLHGYGTNLEGPWLQVSQAIHDCHAAVHAKGISMSIPQGCLPIYV
ncbi:hypothetical protein FA13DRAFT_1728010 [Coprinellus micaceus]|uniref:Thiamine-binding protein domain-containing protein n=1 Tax=Coprinellus micaceus TaxID=71717 RepID=A0A4Y7TQG3_COPMI|nr:hypothetical protein FA13DRAFT_1728010 [Coprinellus micaceus]